MPSCLNLMPPPPLYFGHTDCARNRSDVKTGHFPSYWLLCYLGSMSAASGRKASRALAYAWSEFSFCLLGDRPPVQGWLRSFRHCSQRRSSCIVPRVPSVSLLQSGVCPPPRHMCIPHCRKAEGIFLRLLGTSTQHTTSRLLPEPSHEDSD